MASPANKGQLSRYGAIASDVPMVTGKAYFLVNSSEVAASEWLNRFTPDGDGAARVFTTWAAVISALQTSADADVVFVSPLFVTPPTKAQQLLLNAAYVAVIQAAQCLPDGSYLSTSLTASSLAVTTAQALFAATGRIAIVDIIGEVVTTVGATITGKFTSVPTVGSNTDLCSAANFGASPVGTNLFVTGTLATAMVTSVGGAFLEQAVPIVVTAGNINFTQSATTTGNVKWLVRYKSIDPGAFVSPLV